MWTYRQSTGEMASAAGAVVAEGYSGHGPGVNNPDLEQVPEIGPVPQGLWSAGAPVDDPHLGPFALPLIPHAATQTYGRSGFYCHGDEIGHVGERLASHGCIVLDRPAREAIWQSGDHVIEVTP